MKVSFTPATIRGVDAIPVGPHMLQRFAERLLQRLDSTERKSVQSWLARHPCRLGTMCSGTDAPVLAVQALRAAVASTDTGGDAGHASRFEHVFSVERNINKQQFIDLLYPDVQHIFTNTLSMTCADAQEPRQIIV